MNVFSGLKPHAIMSLAFWNANVLHCSSLRDGLNRNFSSSVDGRTGRHRTIQNTSQPARPGERSPHR